MYRKTFSAALFSITALHLCGCATRHTASEAAAAPYTGPRITLHAAPGTNAIADLSDERTTSAIAFLNARRAELGLSALASDPLIAKAAQAHASYLEVNRAAGHEERAGLPGFSAADVTARVRLHTQTAGASEVFAVYGGQRAPALPIEEIFDSPYHRGAMLYDWGRAGEAVASGNSQIVVVDFADPQPAIGATELVAYPYNGQKDAPLAWQDIEQPDPMGPDTRYRGAILGYPITLSGGTNAHIELATFDLRDPHGKKVRCQIAPLTAADAGRNTAVCTPFSPLRPHTTYSVRATGLLTQQFGVANAPFDLEWSFTTSAAHARSWLQQPHA
ncbi:CAP domain-containing protein [Paraburkholderia sp. Ac-20340]|uniref:CAP domain-containing protein n=1 Tax=Paraburkholderia sp. Ac-20340 TaxID=2703888 RepID=UPI001F11EA14|nr:CAP domain-containing protein [Paraburkholderia sp. Ac-20340]